MILIIYYIVSPITFLFYIMFYNYARKKWKDLVNKDIKRLANFSLKNSMFFYIYSVLIVLINLTFLLWIGNKYQMDGSFPRVLCIIYIVGFVILGIIGTVIQLKTDKKINSIRTEKISWFNTLDFLSTFILVTEFFFASIILNYYTIIRYLIFLK